MENEEQINIPDEVRQAMSSESSKETTKSATTTNTQSSRNFTQPTDAVQKIEYPSEVVELPSKGWFYSPDNPLTSGKVDIKYMTAKEEDILTSQNLIKKGVVLDKLLEQLIVTPGVKLDDILVGDKNAIFISARVLAYGKDYKIKFKDPSTGDDVEDTIDLTKLNAKEFDFDSYTRGDNIFEFTLPHSGKRIHWKLLTHADEQAIDAELKGLKKFTKNKNETSEVTTRLKYIIKAIDGNDDRANIKSFVDKSLLARDSLAFREHIKETTPDLDMTFNFESEDTGYEERMTIPLGVDFFYPSAGV
jgi:hypothetical protein